MVDFMSKETRSRLMSTIKGKDTKPEMAVRRALHAAGFRYSLHSKHFPGRPDLVLRKYKLAIFVHGCFWHGHDCGTVKIPSSPYWEEKLAKNQERDERALKAIKEMGWQTAVIWECTLDADLKKIIRRLKKARETTLQNK